MRLSPLFGLAAIAVAAGHTALAAELELKFGHVGNPGSLFSASADEFAKRANAKLAGKARVAVYGSSQLGSDSELMKKIKLGTVHFALPSTVMSSEVDQFGVFEMPYLVKDRAHMTKIAREVVMGDLEPLAEKKGLQILAVWENGYRHITNNKRPINVPDDLKGIKLRTPSGKWRVKMFQAYGANPSPLEFSEVFVALQTGTFDGQENPYTQIYSAKFQEVQKYLSVTGHVYTPAYVVTGKSHWAGVPADVRKIVEEAAKDTTAFVYQTAEKMENDLLGKIKAAGVQVNNADKDAFVKASKPIYDEFAKTVPGAGALIDKALALAK